MTEKIKELEKELEATLVILQERLNEYQKMKKDSVEAFLFHTGEVLPICQKVRRIGRRMAALSN